MVLVGAEAVPLLPPDCARILVWGEHFMVVEKGAKWVGRYTSPMISGENKTIDTAAKAFSKHMSRPGRPDHALITARWDGKDVSIANVSPLHIERSEVAIEEFDR